MDRMYDPWVQLPEDRSLSDEELVDELCSMTQGIAVLDGYSGCGKTTLLRRVKEEHGLVVIISYRMMLDKLLRDIWKDGCTSVEMLWNDLPDSAILCVEDVDFLKGKTETQQLFIRILTYTAQAIPVIVTGNDMEEAMPQFLMQLSAEIWQKKK